MLVVLLSYIAIVSSTPVQAHDVTTVTTLPPPTTIPAGCIYHNKHYPPGSVIEEGYDPSSNWCHGTYCNLDGQIEYWDDFHCRTTPPTTIPPTTIPAFVQGCLYNGQYYPYGSTIEKGYNAGSNWCYSTYCDRNGQILHGDNFNCVKTTTVAGAPVTTPGPHVVG